MALQVGTATSSRPSMGPSPAPKHAVNTQTKIIDGPQGRILCVADIRGRLSSFNQLAVEHNAKAIIHTGDFGFFESNSLDRINDRTLRHLIMYSPLIGTNDRNVLLAPDNPSASIRSSISSSPTPMLSEFSQLLSGQIKLKVPVYTVWGACEDVAVIEKFRSGQYDIENLHILDEATTRCLDVGGVKLRLLGLGGALVPHKMFDNGDGQATIAGGQGTMWTTALQIGELVDTAQRVYDATETRLLITHASPGREGLLSQLALVVKADLTISAGLHFRYASSYNEFSVQSDLQGFRQKLLNSKESFEKVWDNVKTQVDTVIDDHQRVLLEKALSVVERVLPPSVPGTAPPTEEPAWKNCWNWNLCDAAYGSLVFDIREGRVSAELKSQGFNYAYRRATTPTATAPTPGSASSTLLSSTVPVPSRAPLTAPSSPPKSTATPPVAASDSATSAAVTSTAPLSPVASAAATNATQGNGAAKPNGVAEKGDKSKKNKRDKKDKSEKDKDGPAQSATASTNSPVPSASTPVPPAADTTKPSQDTDPTSPVAGADSAGTRTPPGRRPPRNPWTLFVKSVPATATEAEVREFFGPAKEGITHVNFPPAHGAPRPTKNVFVQFGDEEAMKEGLAKHAEKLKDTTPRVTIAEDRESSGAARGGGRGGRGGAYAQRVVAAQGLGRPVSPAPSKKGKREDKAGSPAPAS